ncbi:ATP-binding protein [methane-oxidizing endosymbiont of Gigantopelta aegis]|uniref:ATP-binding protein n=1 Tax=methane-oxidizing endosymbiont of Gigantopelta aegis TaxID=2794938 RepID=UPI0018DB8650|nr:ATP-binding protein [methane-oxidizing endosymbiont of Gigantopelta aegis]
MLAQVLPKSEISIRENLKWLFVLRNLIIFATIFLMFIVTSGLGIKLPQDQLWLVIFAIAAVNLYTWMRLQTQEPVTELEIFSQLVIDVIAMASMLYLTGGASNPIIWVFLLPVIVTGIMLPQTYTWNMVILTACIYTILIGFNIPLPAIEPHMPDPALMTPEVNHQLHLIRDRHNFNLHIFGMWFGFVFSAGLVAFFVIELSRSLKERERNLAEAREQALRNEKVVSLGTLAASAAHDMGTPLGTIAILSHELQHDFPEHRFPDAYQKLKIMDEQITRCKEALALMSVSAGKMRAESGNIMPVSEYLDELLNLWRADNAKTTLRLFIDPASAAVSNAQIVAEITQTHAIINILNNAAEVTAEDKGIEFHASWTQERLHITIRDFGPGIPPEQLKMLGNQPVKSKKKGMGVGLLLTFSTIKRLGGEIVFSNLESGGAQVEIFLPLITPSYHDEV